MDVRDRTVTTNRAALGSESLTLSADDAAITFRFHACLDTASFLQASLDDLEIALGRITLWCVKIRKSLCQPSFDILTVTCIAKVSGEGIIPDIIRNLGRAIYS